MKIGQDLGNCKKPHALTSTLDIGREALGAEYTSDCKFWAVRCQRKNRRKFAGANVPSHNYVGRMTMTLVTYIPVFGDRHIHGHLRKLLGKNLADGHSLLSVVHMSLNPFICQASNIFLVLYCNFRSLAFLGLLGFLKRQLKF